MTNDRRRDGEQVMTELFGRPPEFGDAYDRIMPVAIEQLFGEIWTRRTLSYRDRELITIALLAEQGGREDQLRLHLKAALRVGLTPDELKEAMVHIACYSGYPAAFSAMTIVAEVLADVPGANAAASRAST